MNLLAVEWVTKAEGDYATALRERFARRLPNYDAACFHAQQMAEKYLKALLQESKIQPPRTHDLIELLSLCPPLEAISPVLEENLKSLNGYAVSARYPGQNTNKEDAIQAVHQAKVVRQLLRAKLGLPVES